MDEENFKKLLDILANALKNNDFGEDNKKIRNLHNSLSIL